MQSLLQSGCLGENNSIFLQDNNENYAFVGIKWSFFDVLPLDIES